MMASIFKKLQDPQLVVTFQRLCGVRSVDTVPETESTPREGHVNGKSNGHANGTKNATNRPHGADNENTGKYVSQNGTANGYTYSADVRNRLMKNGTTFPVGGSKAQGQGKASECVTETNGTVIYPTNSLTAGDEYSNGQDRQQANGSLHSPATNNINKDGITPDDCFIVDNKILHTIFSFGAELGNESFYIVFYPYFFFNIDAWMARRVCWFWCLFMYIGQAAKDIIKWPRPPSPPVFRLEKKYALEYGMPSTHAMVGAGMPFCLFFLTLERYEYPWPIGLAITLAWFALVCFSRIYLGMHSLLDVLVGITSVMCMLPIWLYVMNPLDNFVMTHPLAPWLSILAPLAMCLCYPKLDRWSTARGDTTLVVGVGAGVAFAQWFRFQYGLMADVEAGPPYAVPTITTSLITLHILRMLVGGLLALLTRAVFKFSIYHISCRCVGADATDPISKQRLGVELPTKFVTYVVMGFNTVVVSPLLFEYLGIGRPVY